MVKLSTSCQLMRKDVGPWLMCGAAGRGAQSIFSCGDGIMVPTNLLANGNDLQYVHVSVPVESLVQLSLFRFGSLSCKHADRIYSEPWVPVKMLILDAFLVLLG